MRDLFVTIIVLGSLPVILLEPYIGVLMWAWIGLMNPHRLAWGFARDFPFAMIIALTTLAALLFNSREPRRIPWTREVVILTTLIGWMVITTIFAKYQDLAVEELIKVLKIELMTYVTMMLITDRKRLDQFVWVIVLSLGFYGFKGGIFTITTGGAFHVQGPQGTFIGGNNELGLALIMTLPLMRYLHLQTKIKGLRAFLTSLMGLTVIAILGTQSRGALLGISAMALFLIWKSRKRVPLLLAIAIIVPTALSIMPQQWYNRMATIQTYKHDESAEGRINSWKFAMREALKSPIVGGGFMLFAYRLDVHSIYFEMLGEHGFVGLGLFLLLALATWRAGSKVIRQTKDKEHLHWLRDLAAMVQVSMVGYAVSGAFLGLAYFDFYYYMIAIMVLCKVMAEKALADSSVKEVSGSAAPAMSGAWWRPAASSPARNDVRLRVSGHGPGTNVRGSSTPRS
ncbi:MAG: putative O-glycosylation ligase, exosortase A system-associated [Gammaproteobacteria bacterium]